MMPSTVQNPRQLPRFGRLLFLLAGFIGLTATVLAAEKAVPAFGDAVKLTPFVVHGRQFSVSIHARTDSDRSYGEKFAEEVVGIACETMDKSSGAGLVIVGREGEPHPVVVIRKFMAMAAAGQLDPAVAARVDAITAKLADWKGIMHLDEGGGGEGFKLTFDMLMPALPLPLEGMASKLYQLSWAEGFDDARVEQKLRSLTVADLENDALSKYSWVFYLPPRNAYVGVQNEVMAGVMKKEKMGLFKRAAIKSALVVFKPAVKKAVEGMRKGMLFLTVLRAKSGYSMDDISQLTTVYVRVLMPDFKFNGGTEHLRALEAIETQKVKNAEYAKDPFVKPARLVTFDPAAYAAYEGEYPLKPAEVVRFKREGDSFQWNYMNQKPRVFYPAGDRLLVNEDGTMTIQFLVDEKGAVTGVEERWVRRRQTIPRKVEIAKEQIAVRPH